MGEPWPQQTTSPPPYRLPDAETTRRPGSSCLVAYAGQLMETGAQAECYAKYFIAEHMDASAKTAGFPGATYATLGSIRGDLVAQVTAAKAKGDLAGVDATQKKVDSATSLRPTMQPGETPPGRPSYTPR